MEYQDEELKRNLEVYEYEDFEPSDVKEGVTWRKNAMLLFCEHNREGISPVVTNEIRLDREDTCISCGGYIDFKKDSRDEEKKVYKTNICHYCVSARDLVSSIIWNKYKSKIQ